MLDHLSINCREYDQSRTFYLAALAPLGYSMLMEFEREPGQSESRVGGLGEGGKPDLWIVKGEPGTPMHLALRAENRAAVDAFYRAALAAGAKSNGEPGLRPQYHPEYYGAFVIDPNGHNLEAVCHRPG